MSTATLTYSGSATTIFQRFLWKEYRMLREFWLALAVLTVMAQWFATQFMVTQSPVPGAMFALAWGGAVLYAVGAAVTTFGAENEERTREFLQLIPGKWLPMFLAKVLLAVVSALALALVLSLVGWLIAGREWPNPRDANLIFAAVGVAVLEVIAWGLLISLRWRQPLLAAVATMAAASFGAQLAIAATPMARDSYSAMSYQHAVPMRLLLCVGVFATVVLWGSRWLVPDAARSQPLGTTWWKARRVVAVSTSLFLRRRMLARLLWQTWRQSWRSLVVAVPLAGGLTLAFAVTLAYLVSFSLDLPIHLLSSLLLPAILGSLVFRADQKASHRLFLATHSTHPRTIWLSRQVVWLGVLALLGIVFYVVTSMRWGMKVPAEVMDSLGGHHEFMSGYNWDARYLSRWTQAWHSSWESAEFVRGSVLVWSAVLTAFAVGQFFSLLLKKEVLAGVLAGLFSVVLTAWSLLMFSWRLDPLWFVLPLGLGAMLATWLWMPDWMVGKSLLRTWPKLAVPMLVPMVMIATTLPTARINQLRGASELPLPYLTEALETLVRDFNEKKAAGLETALKYERLYSSLVERFEANSEQDSYRALVVSIAEDGLQEAFAEINHLSLRPRARFNDQQTSSVERLFNWVLQDAQRLTQAGELPDALERYLALSRIHGQLLQQQRSWYVSLKQPPGETWYGRGEEWYRDDLQFYPFSEGLRAWTQHESQSSEQIRGAITQLQKSFAQLPHPREAILADREFHRQVIGGQEPPDFMHKRGGISASRHLALALNLLFWEQTRAFEAIDFLTSLQLNYVDAVATCIDSLQVRNLLRSVPHYSPMYVNEHAFREQRVTRLEAARFNLEALTSSLVLQPLKHDNRFFLLIQGWVDAETRRRALLIELALLAYRLDHGEYPDRLDQLDGEYLDELPLDPYSGREFHYRPRGLDYDLDRRHHREKWISKGTPLLWSVGNGNAQLTGPTLRKVSDDVTEGGWVPEDDIERELYHFTALERSGHSWSQNLVFVLPK